MSFDPLLKNIESLLKDINVFEQTALLIQEQRDALLNALEIALIHVPPDSAEYRLIEDILQSFLKMKADPNRHLGATE